MMHGGKTPETNQNAMIHGIYRRHLTAEEQEQYDVLELGSVDHELRVARIRLARALFAEKEANNKPELDSITENDGGGAAVPSESRTYKVRDFTKVIDLMTARVESLEKTRAALGTTNAPEDMDADGLTRGKPDEDGPPNPVR
jgi:hypothetical protein